MPPTVAPPPRNGEAAQGPGTAEESAALDHAARPHDEPAAEPAHPLPVAAARTAATGVLFSLLSAALGAVALLLVLVLRMLAAGADHLDTGGPSLVLLTIGFALTGTATLLLITRGWAQLRPATLLFATVAAVAWPLSGHALLAAPVALVLVGLLVARDRRVPGGTRITRFAGAFVLALMALVTMTAGAITSPAHDRVSAAGDVAAATATSTATPEPVPERTPAPKPPKAEKTPEPAVPDEPITIPGDTPAPTPTPPAKPRPSAASFVRGYYRDLDAQRFDEAWRTLSPGVQAALGPYARWKAGYSTTVHSKPSELAVSGGAAHKTVTHILTARDERCDGDRRFQVTWHLRADAAGWVATDLGAVALGAQEC